MNVKWTEGAVNDMQRLFSSNPYYAIPRFFRELKWRISYALQRAVKGYDPEYWWGFHNKFTELALINLQILQKNHSGYPANMTEELWNTQLQKMIDGFKASERMSETVSGFDEKDQQIFIEGMKSFTDYYHNLWD